MMNRIEPNGVPSKAASMDMLDTDLSMRPEHVLQQAKNVFSKELLLQTSIHIAETIGVPINLFSMRRMFCDLYDKIRLTYGERTVFSTTPGGCSICISNKLTVGEPQTSEKLDTHDGKYICVTYNYHFDEFTLFEPENEDEYNVFDILFIFQAAELGPRQILPKSLWTFCAFGMDLEIAVHLDAQKKYRYELAKDIDPNVKIITKDEKPND